MKNITRYDEITRRAEAGEKINYKEAGINLTLYRAYEKSKRLGLETIDFADVIWESDTAEIAETLKEAGFREFTISSTFSGLLEIIWDFEKQGFKMDGMRQTPQEYSIFNEETMRSEQATKPAAIIRM